MKLAILLFFAAILLFGCTAHESGKATIPDNYTELIEQWRQDRIETLKQPTGWLRLAGMFWLEEGENSFGSGNQQDIQFPEGTIPEFAGKFVYDGEKVLMNVADGVTITHEEDAVTEFTLYENGNAPPVEHGSLHWFVIEREGLRAIRLYNKENTKADAFKGFPAYPVQAAWRQKARFIPNSAGTTIPVINVLGQQYEAASPGELEFMIDGQLQRVQALEGSERLFIIIADETNRTETYQAGRYIYVDYPENGSDYTVIDFNKLYNPPCAYNVFTTCQLPPPQNRLDVAIEAGEKRPVDWIGLNMNVD